jgi:hypothetical protein
MSQWLKIFGLAIQFGSDVLAAAAEIAGDQPVSSPTIDTYLEGKPYQLVLTLTPVAGQARGNPTSMSWFSIFGIVMQEASAVYADLEEISADQPFSTAPVTITLEGFKYNAVVSGAPSPAA